MKMRKRFQDNGPELYGVDSSNPTTPKTPFYVVQRIISTLAGVQGGTSFVTVKSVANRDVADVKAFGYQGSISKTVMAFRFGNHDPRTPPAASTCQLTFTVPHPYTLPYVMNAITGASGAPVIVQLVSKRDPMLRCWPADIGSS
jgi:hypothetical protein